MEAVQFIREHWDEIVMAVGAVGVACEGTIAALVVLVGALRSLANLLASLAVYTGTDADDRAIASAIRLLDRCAHGLDAVQRWIPRLRVGAARRPVSPGASAALGALLAVGVALSGCAGRALVAADGARAAACIQVERQCVDRYEAGNLTATGAEACVSCTRATCDAIRERIAAGAE